MRAFCCRRPMASLLQPWLCGDSAMASTGGGPHQAPPSLADIASLRFVRRNLGVRHRAAKVGARGFTAEHSDDARQPTLAAVRSKVRTRRTEFGTRAWARANRASRPQRPSTIPRGRPLPVSRCPDVLHRPGQSFGQEVVDGPDPLAGPDLLVHRQPHGQGLDLQLRQQGDHRGVEP
jgi:hypothetical protein